MMQTKTYNVGSNFNTAHLAEQLAKWLKNVKKYKKIKSSLSNEGYTLLVKDSAFDSIVGTGAGALVINLVLNDNKLVVSIFTSSCIAKGIGTVVRTILFVPLVIPAAIGGIKKGSLHYEVSKMITLYIETGGKGFDF